MGSYEFLGKSRYFEVLNGLNRENHSDNKVGMLSEVDMTSAEQVRELLGKGYGLKPSYTAFVAKAVSLTLLEQPHANRVPIEWPFWKRIMQLHQVDMTIAVERDKPGIEQAAYAGTIRNTDRLDLLALTRELQALAQSTPETSPRWRAFKWIVENLPSPLALFVVSIPRFFPKLWIEHRGGSVMISSPAKYGVDMMVAAWPWPIGFSFGLVKDRPLAVDGSVVVRPTMVVTMSFDRRIMGGAPAARFFRSVCDKLADAERVLLADLPALAPDRAGATAAATLRATTSPSAESREAIRQ